jgi:amino acid adenylation domain-containing protein
MDKLACTPAALAIHREINRTRVGYPDEVSVKDLFERCAARHPERAAVIQEGRGLSYRELNERANGLAARLLQEGLQPGSVVGVCVIRSPELVITLLAILKCGAAYLPFDAGWPDERLRRIFDSAGCGYLVTDQVSALARRFERYRLIGVSRGEECRSRANPDVRVPADAIAYLNFTSGSTGVPKGVPIQHRSISRLVCNARYADLNERTRVLQLAPVTFDAATFEIWGALLHGGCCVLCPPGLVRLSQVRTLLQAQGINVLFLTTALFNAIVDECPEMLQSVGTVLTGGELHSTRHMVKALAVLRPGQLVHVYGPTECTTFATYFPIEAIDPDGGMVPIGRPIQNTRIFVLKGSALCEPGELGEICLAGPGLSPGYLGMADLTQQRYVECIIDETVERIYRTGDIGYILPDGNIVFQGREDDQIKINGYRIELGEIAYHLDRHPDIRSSFVTVEQNATGDKSLLAFVVPGSEQCTVKAVRSYLRERLPGFMVPADVFLCEDFPLSAHGKVDRHALLSLYDPGGFLAL